MSVDSAVRGSLVQSYLQQQLMVAGVNNDNNNNGSSGNNPNAFPDAEALDAFKARVKLWMELDNNRRRIQQQQKELTKGILEFMGRYNIEDLNTKDGRLKYDVRVVKAPVSQRALKQKLHEVFSPDKTADQLSRELFEARTEVQRVSLRRIKIS